MASDRDTNRNPDAAVSTPAAAPRLIERGVLWWGYGIAAALPGFILQPMVQLWLIEALAIPPRTTPGGEDGLFATVIMWIVILPDARPAHARQWLMVAAVSVVFFTVAALAWAFAAALVFGLAPELEFGIVVAMLLGVTAAAAGWAAYRLIDRLAGRASPWWDGTDAREGAG